MAKKNKKIERKLLVVFSDTHAGDRQSLLNPESTVLKPTIIKDGQGGYYKDYVPVPVDLNPFQEWLWHEVYIPNVEETFRIADGDPVTVVHNGDLSQGIKYIDANVTVDIAAQMFAATANMLPWFKYKNLAAFRIIWGTASHIFQDGTTPRLVTHMLKKEFPNMDIKQSTHSVLDIDGFVADIAHHGTSSGIRNWTQGNVASYYAKSLAYDYMDGDRRPPDLVVRSHFHTSIEGYQVKFYKRWGRHKLCYAITPSYQGMNGFAQQVTKSKGTMTNGHVVFEIINGKLYDVHWLTKTVDLKSYEVLK